MITIAYIEPHTPLLNIRYSQNYTMIHKHLLNRIEGIMQAVETDPEIQLRWLGNKLNVSNFIKTGEYKDYDGVLLTAPGEKACRLIAQLPGDKVPFMISQDFDPDGDLNYTGPDHHDDIHAAYDKMAKAGEQEIVFVSCEPHIKSSQDRLMQFKNIFAREEIAFDNDRVISPPPKVCKLPHGRERNEKTQQALVKTMAEREGVDVFIFVDPAPLGGILMDLENEYNKKVPQDFKLFSMVSSSAHWPMTTRDIKDVISNVQQDYRTIGRRSIQTLMQIIRGECPGRGNKIFVPGKFIKGRTMSPVPALEKESDESFKAAIMDFIWRNYANPISGKEIARATELSYTYFLKKFKACFGSSLSETINRVRLDQAAKKISGTALPISNILHEVGYTNETTFVRQFKRRFSQTPSDYRNSS